MKIFNSQEIREILSALDNANFDDKTRNNYLLGRFKLNKNDIDKISGHKGTISKALRIQKKWPKIERERNLMLAFWEGKLVNAES